jgi:HupE / UreJ protein
MSTFSVYLQLGFEHIADIRGYDHMLFIITLCAVYALKDWKKVLVLITAFTIGHSVTLAMSALDIMRMDPDLVEFLIPVTIFLTAMHNVIWHRSTGALFSKGDRVHYALALGFGFIHGMGFSNYFRALLGSSDSIVMPLFSFNVGLELGQLCIVIIFFLFYAVLKSFATIQQREWNLFFSGAGAGISIILIIEKFIAL